MSPDRKADGLYGKNWRDIAEEVQLETDPAKVMELVQKLISKLDEEYPVLPTKAAPPATVPAKPLGAEKQ